MGDRLAVGGAVHNGGMVGIDAEAALSDANARAQELRARIEEASAAYYDRDTFDRLYGVQNLTRVKARYDPDDRLTSLYDKAVGKR